MGNFATELGSIPVRGNLGVRYEETKNTITAVDRLATVPATYGQHVYNQHYSNVLPSLMVAADVTDKLVVRFAAYSTLVRPQPRDNIPSTQVTAPTTGNIYTVVLGSVGLKPYTANSYDLSFEWYNRPNGLISLDVYEKDIKNVIEPITDLSRLCPANGLIDGVNYGFGTLSLVGNQCTSSSLIVSGTNAVVNISGNTNGLPLKVNGIEFNAQENLDFLPAPWNNLGGAFNYAYTKISGTNTNGTPATLAGVSKNNVNLIGYYEGKSFGVRIVYNYRDRYDLVNGNTFLGAGTTVKPRGQLDASATLHINDRVDVSLDGFNLTNANLAQYSNDPMHPRILYHEGRTYQATLRATF
jgi:TonB-dependent receptor